MRTPEEITAKACELAHEHTCGAMFDKLHLELMESWYREIVSTITSKLLAEFFLSNDSKVEFYRRVSECVMRELSELKSLKRGVWEKKCDCKGTSATNRLRVSTENKSGVTQLKVSLVAGPSCDECGQPWEWVIAK